MTAEEWIEALAERLGADVPDAATIDALLALAATAAHASERTAAPIACYLVGRAGLDLATAQRLAAEVS